MTDLIHRIWQDGETIDGLYEIKDVLGVGGMGVVQRVHHKSWNIDLAVKSPRPNVFTVNGGIESFISEAQTWVSLGLHPNIVDCYYVRLIDGLPRVFAELVEGGSLKDWIDNRRAYDGSAREVLTRILDISIQFAWGLHFAHEAGLVHQDVKPANVMMTGLGVPKITDFGLAKARFFAGEKSQSPVGETSFATVGGMTPAYCSPEQADGARISRRSDIWSWAVSVLHLLTGEVIWPGGPLAGYILQNVHGGSRIFQVPLPNGLVGILQQCLALDPSQRPATLHDVTNILKAIYERVSGIEYARPEPPTITTTADNLNNQALSLFDLGDKEGALAAWDEALSIAPHHLDSIYNSGLTKWRNSTITDIDLLRRLKDAGQSSNDLGTVEYFRAQVQLEQGDVQSAIKSIENVSSDSPKSADATELLAFAEIRTSSDRCIVGEWTVDGEIKALHFRDNRTLALSLSKKDLLLWDVDKQTKLCSFIGHKERVICAAISNNSRYMLSGSQISELILWDCESGNKIMNFEGHKTVVKSVSFRCDDQYALSCGGHGFQSYDDLIRLWDVGSGRCLRSLAGHTRAVMDVSFSPDGKLAVSGSWDHTIRLWHLKTGNCLGVLNGHEDSVNTVRFSADSRFVLSGSSDNTIRLWDARSGECLRIMKADGRVGSVNFGDDDAWALSTGPLKLWDLRTGRCLISFDDGADPAQFSSDYGKAIYRARRENINQTGVIRVRNLAASDYTAPLQLSLITTSKSADQATRLFELEIENAKQFLNRGEFENAKDQVRLARNIPGFDKHSTAIELWSHLYSHIPVHHIQDSWEIQHFSGYDATVEFIGFTCDGRTLFTGTQRETGRTSQVGSMIRLIDISSGAAVTEFDIRGRPVSAAIIDPNGQFLFAGGIGHAMSVWEVRSGRCIWEESGEKYSTFQIKISLSKQLIVSSTSRNEAYDSFVEIRDFHGSILNKPSIPYANIDIGADGETLLTCVANWDADGEVTTHVLTAWNLPDLEIISQVEYPHTESASSLSTTPSGKRAVLSYWDGTLELRDVTTGKTIVGFKTGNVGTFAVAVSPDGRFVATPGPDCAIKIWDLNSGQCAKTLLGHSMDVQSICFSPDQKYILSGSQDRTAKLWFLDWSL